MLPSTFAHALGIGARGLGRRLRAAQLGGRDHLHGLGDLLRRLGGGDADAHVLEAGHASSLAPPSDRAPERLDPVLAREHHHANVLA